MRAPKVGGPKQKEGVKMAKTKTLQDMHARGKIKEGMTIGIIAESFKGMMTKQGAAYDLNMKHIPLAPPSKKDWETEEEWTARNLAALNRTQFDVVRVNDRSIRLAHKAYSGKNRVTIETTLRTDKLDNNPVEVVFC